MVQGKEGKEQTMSRYIDADALAYKVASNGDADFINKVTKLMIDAPSIDIEPKRGEWVKRTHGTLIALVNFAYCSECGQPIMHEHTRSLWSFCPNCGADMREREGE